MEKQPSFEASIARLEEIARIMESGDITLEESIKLYEEGMRLAGFCGEQLKNAEEKIITLSDLTGEEG
ncbi:MAG TPA: exodeoxyribonuclease VII small subunit [Ruminococcaceae bacterium]|nr:exodeoxyribonuclease VII small subunit [Oscillospiraceae bacterium]